MILVTGGSGLLGRCLQEILDAKYLSSKEYDLRSMTETKQCFSLYRPKIVIHLAAKAGGIVGNSNNAYDFYYDNITINTNVLHCCLAHHVDYVISMAGTCIYPENPPALPLTEDMIHVGSVHISNRGYSYAKRMLQVQMECARLQHGKMWGLFLPGNLYGPYDNFDLESGHVVPSLLRRVHEAKVNNYPSMTCYGTGAPLRQFTYAKDVAKAIVQAVNIKLCGEYNVCNQQNQSILELVTTIAKIVKYTGEIKFNNKMDGVYRKEASDQKLQSHINLSYSSLYNGLVETYKWYCANNLQTVG
ncbi:hypothetical protein LCGC14_2501970 [marine sediment metagenome]|uniref:NAD-dependent epimerase/dehydratase domain-containing protein n=1 Tax=marine sediment metagenome TaxID=412755 RepID=A0A0F9B2E7_9ZZZZ